LAISLVEWLECLTANAKVATVLGFDLNILRQWNLRGGREAVLKKAQEKIQKIHPVLDLIHLKNLSFENLIQQNLHTVLKF
jgi:hypothetical protein